MDTYLEEAIDTYRKITTLDFTIYSGFVFVYLNENGVKTLDDIRLFKQFALIDVMDSKIFCKRIDETYLIEPEEIPNGVELSVDPKIKLEVDELNPSMLRGAVETILSILGYIKQVRVSFPSLPDSNDENNIRILNELPDNIKQALIYLALLKGNEELRDDIIEKLNIKLFSYFSKSILNGEYLILNDYKKKLDKIEEYFNENVEKINESGRKIGRFYTEKAFLRVSWYLQEACSSIKRYLSENQESNLLLVNSDRKKRFRRKEIYKNKYLGAEKTKIYESLLESIIQMTVIDHYFRSDAETVENLFHLYDQIKELKASKGLINNELYVEVIDEVLAKVSTMLDLILNNNFHIHTDEKIDVDYYYIINSKKSKDDFIDNELAQYCKRDTSSNLYISDRKKYKGEEFKFQEMEFEYDEEKFSDLKLYHEAVTTGMTAYCEQSKIISKIHHCTNNNCGCTVPCAFQEAHERENENIPIGTAENVIEDMVVLYTEQQVMDAIKEFIEKQPSNLSPSFFRQVLEFIEKLIVKEDNHPTAVEEGKIPKIREYHALLKKTLNLLYKFLNKFVSDVPFFYRPYFEYSFYSCSVEKGIIFAEIAPSCVVKYNKNNFKGKFFFASIDCMPINYLYLTKLYNKYKVFHKEYVYSYDENSRETLREKFDALSEKVELTLNDKITNVDTLVSATLDETSKLVDEKLDKTSTELINKNLEYMIVSLGIFAAFIAFVTISINLVKVAQNIWQYAVFSCTFTICLLLFVVYLKQGEIIVSHIKDRVCAQWKMKRIFKYMITLLFAAFGIIGVMILTSKLPVFNADMQLQRHDSIINTYLNKEKQMLKDYELLLKDYKKNKTEKDSLRSRLISPGKDTRQSDIKTKKSTKLPN